jgi:hypothetical protein
LNSYCSGHGNPSIFQVPARSYFVTLGAANEIAGRNKQM